MALLAEVITAFGASGAGAFGAATGLLSATLLLGAAAVAGTGFVAACWSVKKVGKELFEMANLRSAELDLRLQYQTGVGIGVTQAALQAVAF